MRRYLALCLSVLMVFPGCASYTVRPAPAPKIVTMPFSRIENAVMVAVDPYIQPERQKEVFDADLKKLGVLPLYLVVENRGDRELSLQRFEAIALELPDGSQINPVDASPIARRLGRGDGDGGFKRGDEVVGAVMLLPLLFPVALAILAAQTTETNTTEARIADYTNKEFKDVVLSKNDSAHGFVYFMPPEGTLWYTKARLVLRFVDKTAGTSFVIRVPVSESGFFKGGPVDTKKEERTSE